jgi:hypothetical protein
MKNHYDILGVSRTASSAEIKTAYHKLSIKFHPDKNNGEAFFSEMFRQVNEAYIILYDANKRKAYDTELYKYEHPQKIIENFQKANAASTANQNVKTQSSPNYYSTTKPKVSVWDGVAYWRKIRNYMLGINGFLILILLISNSTSTKEIAPLLKDTVVTAHPIVKHKNRHKAKKVAIDTTAKPSTDSVMTKAITDLPAKDTVKSDTSISLVKSPVSDLPEKISADTPKKKKGFFKRLFGKNH